MPDLTAADRALLLRLLDLPTAGPLESPDRAPRLWQAQRLYAEAAAAIGFEVVHHAAATPADLDRPGVPAAVREAAARSPEFLGEQPSLVLRLGPAGARTVMFNVHLDTVAGHQPVSFDGECFHGRGAIDAKGPAVALLAGIRAAVAAQPAVGTGLAVLVQAVSGEEGGALGTFGTRPLVERGHVGELNVFCEPTGLRYLPRATAAATARIRVRGTGSIDDRPGEGHNATVLLGFLAQHLATELACDRACVAGLHTGEAHNRVYGRGDLLVNLPYATAAEGARLTAALDRAVAEGLGRFQRRFGDVPELAKTAADAAEITAVNWLKRDLPTLACDDPGLPELMRAAGIERWPDREPAFTCDAIWTAGRGSTVVLGPGDLAANNAHAEGEFARLAELTAFAAAVARLLTTLAARNTAPKNPSPENGAE